MKAPFMILMTMILLAAYSFSACSATAAAPLEGTAWTLSTLNGTDPIEGREITIRFTNAEINGTAGCNSYFGSYETKDNTLSFGPTAMTEMACMEPEGIMEQELAYLRHLSAVDTYIVNDSQLILSGSDGEVNLVYTLQP